MLQAFWLCWSGGTSEAGVSDGDPGTSEAAVICGRSGVRLRQASWLPSRRRPADGRVWDEEPLTQTSARVVEVPGAAGISLVIVDAVL